uniref:Uncharacterized protein n=1 Tax=Anguilla anguilla TaxID=7936 RepID=A0A0E9S6J9_ANGAN
MVIFAPGSAACFRPNQQ